MRTLRGVANFRFFVGKDFVAYCEGGNNSLSLSDVDNGKVNVGAADITFWSVVFAQCAGKHSVHIKPVGSKTAVEAIAKAMIARGDKRVMFFMDRDFQHLLGTCISSPLAIYTRRYAWENDVLFGKVVGAAAVSIAHLNAAEANACAAMFDSSLLRLHSILRWPLFLQVKSLGTGCSFVPTDENCAGAFELDRVSGEVHFKRKALLKRLTRYRADFAVKIRTTFSDATHISNIPGHVLMGLAVRVVQGFLIKRGMISAVSFNTVHAVLLEKFKGLLKEPTVKDIMKFYRPKIRAAVSAA